LILGKLQNHDVHKQRGSATDDAAPDEIFLMGVFPNIDTAQRIPALEC
jgi:hypothetical protein